MIKPNGPVERCIDLLKNCLRILIVEDEEEGRTMLREFLCSPLYDINTAESFKTAIQEVENGRWHCWIVDMDLGDGCGTELLKAYPNFCFKMVVSGLRRMQTAFDATRNGGALAIFDKGSPELPESGCYRIDGIAALGFLLKGHCPNHLPSFLALLDNDFRTVKSWAEFIAMVPRNLEGICEKLVALTPHRTLIAFRALTYVLGQTGIAGGRGQYSREGQEAFSLQCLETMLNEWDCVYRPVFSR
jgi:CheY-like chemotaxis protein